jgi:hypothetical protein
MVEYKLILFERHDLSLTRTDLHNHFDYTLIELERQLLKKEITETKYKENIRFLIWYYTLVVCGDGFIGSGIDRMNGITKAHGRAVITDDKTKHDNLIDLLDGLEYDVTGEIKELEELDAGFQVEKMEGILQNIENLAYFLHDFYLDTEGAR